ncbi:MAG: serine/threonine-protein kinase, partial [Polyangia bacterium]|nr:serine/threonine-protein kinase [Polyangia bacterium]
MNEAPNNQASKRGGPAPTGAEVLGPGVVLGGVYRIEEKLGEGGLGALFRAVDLRSETDVALRVLKPELAGAPDLVAFLQHQAELSASLDHKNIARTYGMAVEGAVVFLVTEHVSGQSLRDIIDRKREAGKPFSLKGAYNIVAHLCNACGYAHELTFHGALHPGNVLVNPAGRIKVTEYGIGRTASGLGNVESLLGGQGFMYLAPEMAQSPREADERADIYAIGVILNELLTGRSPAETFETPSSVRPGLPVEVDQVIGRCMRPLPDERFETIQELKLALMGALEGAAEVPAAGAVEGGQASGDPSGGDIDIDIDLDVPAVELKPVLAPSSRAPSAPAPAPAPQAAPSAQPAPRASTSPASSAGGLPPGLPPVPAAAEDPFGATQPAEAGSGLPGLPGLGGDA